MADVLLKDLFHNNIGNMEITDDMGMYQVVESYLNNLFLFDAIEEGDTYTGELNFANSPFYVYPWAGYKRVKAVFKKAQNDCFTATVYVDAASIHFDLSPLNIVIKGTYLVFVNEMITISGKAEYRSKASLVFDVAFPNCPANRESNSEDISTRLSYTLFNKGHFTQLVAEFYDESGKAGVPIYDCFSILPRMFGLKVDFVQILPQGIEFLNFVFIYGFDILLTGDKWDDLSLYDFSATIGVYGNAFSLGNDSFQLNDMRLTIGFNRKIFFRNIDDEGDWELYSTLTGNLIIGNKEKPLLELSANASFPTFDIDIMSGKSIKIDEIVSFYLNRQLPKAFALMEIDYVHIRIYPKSDYYSVDFSVSNAVSINISETAVFRVERLKLCMQYEKKALSGVFSAALVLCKNEKPLLMLYTEAAFDNEGLHFNAALTSVSSKALSNDITISDIYGALFNKTLPAAFSKLVIKQLHLGFTHTDSNKISDLALTIGARVKDLAILGQNFDIDALLQINNDMIRLDGSIRFEFIEASVQITSKNSAENMTVLCKLKFDTLEITLSNGQDSTGKFIKGTFTQAYTLGQAAIYLARLLNPNATVSISGEWGFLNKISLNGVTLYYYTEKKILKIIADIKTNLPFLNMQKAGLQMNCAGNNIGVSFIVVGSFLGNVYTENAPLTWDSSSKPPLTTGKPLNVEYLALSSFVRIETPGKSVLDNLTALQKLINKNTEPTKLKVSGNVGYMFGLSCKIMDTLEMKLIYNEYNRLWGGLFKLYGDKASKLKGLEAEIMYTRLNDSIGVFSGRIIPPDYMRRIDIGALVFGIGDVSVSIYTNGDFDIDLGYPHNNSFAKSFTVQFGVFSGRGGVWIKKDSLGRCSDVPKTTNGYYSPVLFCGVGLEIGLKKGFSIAILSANVSITMTGMFTGVFATLLENNKKPSDYYKVSAFVGLVGNLNGSVNFGIIGASVSITISASAWVTIETAKPTYIAVDLSVRASASVKVLWWRINFGFSLNFRLDFTIGRGSPRDYIHVDRQLSLPPAQHNDIIEITLKALSMYSVTKPDEKTKEHATVLFAALSRADFEKIVTRLAEYAEYNGYLGETHGMELFVNFLFFKNSASVIDFILNNFIFTLDFAKEQDNLDNSVIMPIPYCVTVSHDAVYNNGAHAYMETNLESCAIVTGDYLRKIAEYYRRMNDEDTVSVLRSANDNASLSQFIFIEYFELILKAIRTEKSNTEYRNEVFSYRTLTEASLDNIIGITQRFLLSGKRTVSLLTEANETIISMYKAAGQLMNISNAEEIVEYVFSIKLNTNTPQWFRLANGEKNITLRLNGVQLTKMLPHIIVSKSVFKTGYPRYKPFFGQKNKAVKLSNKAVFGDTYDVFDFHLGKDYAYSYELNNDCAGFGLVTNLALSSLNGDAQTFTIVSATEIDLLNDLLKHASKQQPSQNNIQITFWYKDSFNTDVYKQIKGSPVIIKNKLSDLDDGKPFFAQLSTSPLLFFELIVKSLNENASYYLSFNEAGYILNGDNTIEFVMLVAMPPTKSGTCYSYQNCVYQPLNLNEPIVTLADFINESCYKQGRLGIEAIRNTGSTEEEQWFLNLYSNLSVELSKAESVLISGESVPVYTHTNVSGEQVFEIEVPYYRFIDEKNIYAGIHNAGETYKLMFSMIDMLGNKIPLTEQLTVVPKYSDILQSPADYEGMSIRYHLDITSEKPVLFLTFDYQRLNDDIAEFKYSVHQLSQKDAELYISWEGSKILPAVLLEKNEILAFLSECMTIEVGKTHAFTKRVELAAFTNNNIQEIVFVLGIKRDKSLCIGDSPEKVYRNEVKLEYSQASGLGHIMRQDSVVMSVLKGDSEYYLSCFPRSNPVKITRSVIWSWVTFPEFSGYINYNHHMVLLGGLDLQAIWEQFRQDVAYLLSPAIIKWFYYSGNLELLNRLGKAKNMAIDAVSRFIRLNGKANLYSDKDSMSKYVAELLRKNFDIRLEELIMLQCYYECEPILYNSSAAKVCYFGNLKDTNVLLSKIDVSVKNGFFNICLPLTEEIKNTEFCMEYIEVYTQESPITLTADDDTKWHIPINFDESVLSGLQELNMTVSHNYFAPPVMLFQHYSYENSIYQCSFKCSIYQNYRIYFTLEHDSNEPADDKEQLHEPNDIIADMYRYYVQRNTKIETNAIEELIALMELYANALKSYDGAITKPTKESSDTYCISFDTDDKILRSVRLNKELPDLNIYYKIGRGKEIMMERERNSYLFRNGFAPVISEVVQFRMEISSTERIVCRI